MKPHRTPHYDKRATRWAGQGQGMVVAKEPRIVTQRQGLFEDKVDLALGRVEGRGVRAKVSLPTLKCLQEKD